MKGNGLVIEINVNDIFKRPVEIRKILDIPTILNECVFSSELSHYHLMIWVEGLTGFHNNMLLSHTKNNNFILSAQPSKKSAKTWSFEKLCSNPEFVFLVND